MHKKPLTEPLTASYGDSANIALLGNLAETL